MGLKIADRSAVDAFRVMDVMRAAQSAEQAGRAVCHLEVGQPGTPAPLAAREAVPFAPGDLDRCLARMEAENRIMVDRIQQEVYLI